MKLAIIAAVSKNRIIGYKGKLPWHISEDLKRFKKLTTGNTVLMGRKTFESIGKSLPNRRNVVLSSKQIPGIETFPTLAQALEALEKEEKVFVIGGGELFMQLIDHADELFLTLVDQTIIGDTFFPPYAHLIGERYILVSREEHQGYAFEDYRKR